MTKRVIQHPIAPCGDCPGCPDGICTLGKDLANIIATLVRCEKRETDLGAVCLWLAEHGDFSYYGIGNSEDALAHAREVTL